MPDKELREELNDKQKCPFYLHPKIDCEWYLEGTSAQCVRIYHKKYIDGKLVEVYCIGNPKRNYL